MNQQIILFILSCIYFTYIRILTLYFTETVINRDHGYELNPFMKEKRSRWINLTISLIGCYVLSFFAFIQIGLIEMIEFGILLVIFWIDFQNDWKVWSESNSRLTL